MARRNYEPQAPTFSFWSRHQIASKREIAFLHVHLSLVAQVAKPGWVFLCQIVDEVQKVRNMDDQITLSSDFLAEVPWSCSLVSEWNGVSLIYEDQWTANANFNLWTDASGIGFGAYWESAYLLGEFSDWAHSQSITFKELYAIMAAMATWCPSWSGKQIHIYCNNKSICQILRHQNSWSTPVAALLWTLYHLSVKFGCLISAMHLLGVDNTWADCLSRG